MSLSSTYTFEVPFFDVDSMQVAWHGHYVKYLELARCQLLDEIGFNYHTMKDQGYMFPIVDMHIKYVGALTFGQVVDVVATLSEWEYRLKIEYEILDHNRQQRLTKAYTIQAAIDSNTKALLIGSPQTLIDQVSHALAAS